MLSAIPIITHQHNASLQQVVVLYIYRLHVRSLSTSKHVQYSANHSTTYLAIFDISSSEH